MRLSICMMVKNEEKYLEQCLLSLRGLRNAIESELIIVDTGSVDKTVEIAKKFADKIYFHPWNNHFADMRNLTISYASGEWVLIIDGDEVMENVDELINFLKSPACNTYSAVAITCKNITNIESNSFSFMNTLRLFKRDENFKYEGAVHHQVVFKGETIAFPSVMLLHYGYVSNDDELMEKKFRRTSKILHEQLEKDPKNVYYWAQLSVTYGMHKEYDKAIEYGEKAYSLLPTVKRPQDMFVLIQLILSYHHESQTDKMLPIAEEALRVGKDYLDVYYYYADGLAVKERYEESIVYLKKYLKCLDARKSQDKQDLSVIEYSLGNEQLAFFNMSRMLKFIGKHAEALEYAKKITDHEYIQGNIGVIIELYGILNEFQAMRKYYEEILNEQEKKVFLEILAKQWQKQNSNDRDKIAVCFVDVPHYFALLCRLYQERNLPELSIETEKAVQNLKVEEVPVYCSSIFYFLLKRKYSIEKFCSPFKESWFNVAFDYIFKLHQDLSQVLLGYVDQLSIDESYYTKKLHKLFIRYVLLLNEIDQEKYMTCFQQYVNLGTVLLESVYSQNVFDQEMVLELKNDEEVFFWYMRLANQYIETDKILYLQYLRQALQAFPEMKSAIEYLLNSFKEDVNVVHNEFELYKQQVKNNINLLIDQGQLLEAKALIKEYKDIVASDMEIILMESKILLQ